MTRRFKNLIANPRTFSDGMMLCWLLTMSLFVPFVSGCDKISTAKVDQQAAIESTFRGADKIVQKSKGIYLLNWTDTITPGKNSTYDVFGLKLVDQTGYSPELFTAAGEQIDDTSSYLATSLANTLSPAGKGTRIGSAINETTFELSANTFLTGNGIYLLQVRKSAGSSSKTLDLNSEVIVLRYGVSTVSGKTLATYTGCTAAVALNTSTAKIDFKYPTGADKIDIFRDAVNIATIDDPTVTTVSDKGLSQGESYTYTCQATAGTDKKKGTPITVTMPAVNAPTFSGISALTVVDPNTLAATWPLATGTATFQFKLYCSPGTSIDWTQTPVATIAGSSTTTATIANLGDEIPYACGVRACAFGNVCDTNTTTLVKTLPDGGAPKSEGITGVKLVNGQAVVTAPWQLKDGATWKRRVYTCVGNIATCGTNLASYTLATTNISPQVYAPNTTITLSTAVAQNTTYSLLLTDEDTSGNVSGVQATPILLVTGDLTKPTFSGLTSLTVGTPANQSDTSLTLNFTGTTREIDNAVTGAAYYQIYSFQGSGDACASGSLRSEFSTTTYTPGSPYTYQVTGLTPRTTYSFCLKARDSAGNISDTTQYYTKQTQDVTAPAFDGIQGISYDSSSGMFTASWNRSTSTDRSTYKFSISKNNGTYTTYTYTDAAQPNGISFTKTSLGTSFADLDLLKIYVNACDDASTIVGGTDNCTTLTTPLIYTVPDVSPPSNFVGIDSGNTVNAGQGSVTVAWTAPSPVGTWSTEGYRGFIVYSVDSSNNLTQLKDCACAQTDCSDHPTSCTLTGLDARRTYKFHVRAYDGSRNITTSLNPATSVASLQTVDTTAPTFTGNVATSIVSSAVQITWSTATDNQYASEAGAALTYQLYRKTGSNFGSLTSPQTDADGAYPVNQTTTSYSETSVTAGTTYYYTVCVKDASNNRTCAPASTSITPPDLIVPTVTAFASNKTATTKTWNLTWTMSDNVTILANLRWQLYMSYSATAGTATTSDTLAYSGTGTTTKTGLTGRLNANEYINYLLVVTDEVGNSSQATLSVYSTTAVTITSITRNSGSTAGGKFIWIQGTGFDSAATVTIGGVSCTNSTVYYTSTMMGCKTPAAVAGAYNLVVTNTDTSSATATYTYYTYTGAGSDNICDNPTQPTATFYSGGGNSNVDPYLICTGTQFMLIDGAASAKYFKLMDNLDVTSFNSNNFGNISFTNKTLNGNNMVIANWTRTYTGSLPNDSSGAPTLGLVFPSGGTITDLGLVNVNLSLSAVPSHGNVGAIAGYAAGSFSLTNVFAQGTVTGNTAIDTSTGGLIGWTKGSGGTISGSRFIGTVSATPAGGNSVGGLIGYIYDYAGAPTTIINSYSIGSVSNSSTNIGAVTGGLIGAIQEVASTTANMSISGSYSTMTVTGYKLVGGLIGQYLGGANGYATTISSCYATGAVTGSNNSVGGLIGDVGHTAAITAGSNFVISNSYATGAVSGAAYVGGLVGYYQANGCTTAACSGISNSYATGSVTASNATGCAGGFIGQMQGNSNSGAYTPITNSYATGNVQNATSTSPLYLGGFMGSSYNSYTISNSYASGNVSGVQYVAGFIADIGYANVNGITQTISNSYATGSVTATAASSYAGGFIGLVESCANSSTTQPINTISQSYTTSNVNAVSYGGGFVGNVIAATCSNGSGSFTINDSYSKGSILGTSTIGGFAGFTNASVTLNRVFATGLVGGSSTVGGLIGSGTGTTVSNSFWDATTSSQATSSGGTSKTTAQMQTQATFTTFDFVTTPVWKISAGQYPKLNWQP